LDFGTEKNDDALVSSQGSGAGERSYTAPNGVPLNYFCSFRDLEAGRGQRHLVGASGEHVLRLAIPKAGLSAFTFTFG
jgi:hypothetical protein